jgi:FHA domain/Protein of unknown function (DUF3662)
MFARAYATSIRPISLGRQLIGLIDLSAANGSISNNYEIRLHSDDLVAFADVEQHLVRELIDAATQHCKQSGYSHGDPISVVLQADETIKSGTFQIKTSGHLAVKTPAVEAKPSIVQELIAQPEPTPPTIAPKALTVKAALVLATGQRFELIGDSVKIGRHESCAIVFADSNVSRVHAQIQHDLTGWYVVDLGSTNGVKVNGTKILKGELLADGDELTFGTTTARFVAS